MTRAQVLEYHDVVRRHFRETFQVENDKGFINHQSVSEETVQAYADQTGDGPNDDDLHFHMEKGPENVWNKEVLELLLQQLNQRLEDEEESLRSPTPSNAFWMELLINKYNNVRKEWRVGASRKKADGSYETPEEVVGRVEETHNDKGEKARRGRRRRDVRGITAFIDGCY